MTPSSKIVSFPTSDASDWICGLSADVLAEACSSHCGCLSPHPAPIHYLAQHPAWSYSLVCACSAHSDGDGLLLLLAERAGL